MKLLTLHKNAVLANQSFNIQVIAFGIVPPQPPTLLNYVRALSVSSDLLACNIEKSIYAQYIFCKE